MKKLTNAFDGRHGDEDPWETEALEAGNGMRLAVTRESEGSHGAPAGDGLEAGADVVGSGGWVSHAEQTLCWR